MELLNTALKEMGKESGVRLLVLINVIDIPRWRSYPRCMD
jgi:hypothetical protein